jgi:hypothetical protein
LARLCCAWRFFIQCQPLANAVHLWADLVVELFFAAEALT